MLDIIDLQNMLKRQEPMISRKIDVDTLVSNEVEQIPYDTWIQNIGQISNIPLGWFKKVRRISLLWFPREISRSVS